MYIQPFVQAYIKENIKAPRHWPLWGEFTDDRWIPLTKGQYRENWFPFYDVIMSITENDFFLTNLNKDYVMDLLLGHIHEGISTIFRMVPWKWGMG